MGTKAKLISNFLALGTTTLVIESLKIAKKLSKGKFDLEDFQKQLIQMKKLGGIKGILSLMPGVRKAKEAIEKSNLEDKTFIRMGAIISSMTKKEKVFPDIIKASRKIRISKGSGTSVQDINKLLKQFKPTWIEEPVRWADDRRELKILSRKTNIPISGGESENTIFGCRSLIEDNAVQILQFDCTMFGGFTNGKKLSALCELNHLDIALHHDCYIHAPLVASSPSGRIVESFDDERDPLQAQLFENPHKISDGWIYLNEKPGLGLEISETALKKFGKLVYKNK